jgi:hypothetical protein
MIDFTLSGKNIYKVYFVSKFKTEPYFIQASSEDEVKEFLMYECNIFGRNITRSNKSIGELFDQLNSINKKYRHSFVFARGTYFYIKDFLLMDYIKKTSPKNIYINKNSSKCVLM